LLAGCLFQQNTMPEQPAPVDPEKMAKVAPMNEVETVPSPPAPPSDYHVRDANTFIPATCAERRDDRSRCEIQPAVGHKTVTHETPEIIPPPTRDAPLVGALRCALEKHPAEARRLLQQYGKNDRELLLALLRLTVDLSEGDLKKLSPEMASRTLERLSAVTNNLRQRAPLTLEKVCFCKKIQGFGRYTPLGPEHTFQAGSEGRPGDRVQIYAELRNFASNAVEGVYETVLESTLEIRDAERREVATIHLGRCIDRSLTPRQDYFLNFQLHVPAKLTPGLYTLWVKVKDVTTDSPRETSSSLDFKVRAPGERP
jgi:hypothetical protein